MPSSSARGGVQDSQWELLLRRIASGKCTPFLGAGAAWPTLPMGKDVALVWAKRHRYPLKDRDNLPSVAQYVGVGVHEDLIAPKEELGRHFAGYGLPDFESAGEPHAALAKLPIPIYITTNYDNFMAEALRREGRNPHQEICRWNDHDAVSSAPGFIRDDPDFEPTVEEPLIFHLHGRLEIPESLVLTEDDYLDFLVAISSKDILPDVIRVAFAGTSLLFIGYSLSDWDFRVLHRGLVMAGSAALRRISITVQLPHTDRRKADAHAYLEKYFKGMGARVYWGNANEFAADLGTRWRAFA